MAKLFKFFNLKTDYFQLRLLYLSEDSLLIVKGCESDMKLLGTEHYFTYKSGVVNDLL